MPTTLEVFILAYNQYGVILTHLGVWLPGNPDVWARWFRVWKEQDVVHLHQVEAVIPKQERDLWTWRQGIYDHVQIWKSHILYDKLPHIWHQWYSLGANKVFVKVSFRLTWNIVWMVSAKKIGRISNSCIVVSVLLNEYQFVLIIL